MAKLRIPASGPFIEGANAGDVLIWDGTEWNPGAIPAPPVVEGCADFVVRELSDLPDPVGGVITLESGNYCFGSESLSLDGNRLVLPATAVAHFSQGRILTDNEGPLLELQAGSAFAATGTSFINQDSSANPATAAVQCDVSLGQYVYFDRCFFDQFGSAGQAVKQNGGRLVLSRCRATSAHNILDVGAGADGKTFLYGTRLSNTTRCINVSAAHAGIIWVGGTCSDFTTGIEINAALDGLNVVSVEGNDFFQWLVWNAGAVLTAQIANCRMFTHSDGIVWPAASLPSRVMSVLSCHFEQTPFSGFTAASARAMVRGCSSSGGLITETAIVP